MGLFAATRYRTRVLSGVLRPGRQAGGHAELQRVRTLIVGAGEAGRILGWRFLNQPEGALYDLVGYIDDDPRKRGMLVHGVPVFGGRSDIAQVSRVEGAELIVLAISNISVQALNEIVSVCETTSAQIKVVPSPYERLQDPSSSPLLCPITLVDLMGRQAVSTDERSSREFFADSTVMVTGAAGSVGSELCRQVLAFDPRSLIMLDSNETGLFELQLRLRSCTVCPVVADVTERRRLDGVFQEHRPQIAFHAAAYKHVPLMEGHVEEAIRVNVGGTVTLAEAAAEHGCERFVFVSSDKAVEPVSIMGATKRVGEMLIASGAWSDSMLSTAVRFGNVLGSRGSVVPVFEYQIAQGGPITITDPDATRYFMSVAEAARLILEAATMAESGGVLLLDMGDPVPIVDLAHRLVRLHGLRLGQDIEVVYTGLRPGEKLHEQLVSSSEHTCSTSRPGILKVCARNDLDPTELACQVRQLLRCVEQGVCGVELKEQLFGMVRDSAQPRVGAH
jgi:FlaA1/EpsC-like NDP-sugar epimerase